MNIETERLILIPIREEHAKDIYEHFNEEVTKYMIPTPAKHIDETKKVVAKFIRQYADNTDQVYATTLKDNGEFIGLVGLHNLKNEVPELGLWTKIGSHGNHYGRESIGGLISHAKSMGIKKLCYLVDKRNTASRKIPVFYGGKLVSGCKDVKTPDGRILQEEIYEIEV